MVVSATSLSCYKCEFRTDEAKYTDPWCQYSSDLVKSEKYIVYKGCSVCVTYTEENSE